MCQWYPVDAEKSREVKIFLNFILTNQEEWLEKGEYSLGRSVDGTTKLMILVKGRQENNEKKHISTYSRK